LDMSTGAKHTELVICSSGTSVTRDVVFDGSTQWSWIGGEDGGEDLIGDNDNMFIVQYIVL
jgi:hypothetical protein